MAVGYDDSDTSSVTIDGNWFQNTVGGVTTGNQTGIWASGASTKIQNNDLTAQDVGIMVDGNATVDAGGGTLPISGYVSSTGGNILTGYTGIGGNYAIKDLNTVADGQPDVMARNNDFGPYVDISVIEDYVYDDTDDATRTEVDFGGALNHQTAVSTVYVDDSWVGTPLGVDPDDAGPATAMGVDAFATITEGVNAVAAAGTVHVYDGQYYESNVAVDKAMTIEGQSEAGVVLYSNLADSNEDTSFGTYDGEVVSYGFLLQSGSVTIRGLTIDGDNPTTTGIVEHRFRAGIMTNHTIATAVFNDVAVDNVTVQHTYRRGIQIYSADAVGSGNSIVDSKVDDVTLGPAIAVFDADVTISGSQISNTSSGIEVIYWGAGIRWPLSKATP